MGFFVYGMMEISKQMLIKFKIFKYRKGSMPFINNIQSISGKNNEKISTNCFIGWSLGRKWMLV